MRIPFTCLALLSLSAGIVIGQTPATSTADATTTQTGVTFKALLEQLDTEIAGDFGGKLSNDPNGRRVIVLATQFQSGIARGQYENSRNMLAELLDAMPTPQGKQIVIQLQQALPEEVKASKDALAAQVAALRDKAASICLAAKKESDLDPLFDEIEGMQIALGPGLDAREQEKLSATREFLVQWQKYLAQNSNGYEAAALAILRSIRDNPTSYPLMPLANIDSQIDLLAQSGPAERVEKVLSGLKTLDELPAAIEAIQSISHEDAQGLPTPGILNELERLESGAVALKSGDYAAALAATIIRPQDATKFVEYGLESGGPMPSGVAESAEYDRFPKDADSLEPEIANVIYSLRGQLLSAVLPAYIALQGNPRPMPGEDPSQYLIRLAGEAAARSDYGAVSQILSAYRVCAFDGAPPPWVDSAIAGCTTYFQGQKLEQAGSFAAAIVAYHRVLEQAPGRFNPVDLATARIAALRKDHSTEFDKAVNGLLEKAAPISPLGG